MQLKMNLVLNNDRNDLGSDRINAIVFMGIMTKTLETKVLNQVIIYFDW